MKRKNSIYLLVLILLLSLIAGCGGNEKTVKVNEINGSNEVTEAVKDTVVMAIKADIATLDPHFSATIYNEQVYVNIYDTLITIDESGDFIPCLAKDWDISEDKLTYTFKLEEGVKFHNGEELKASNVVFSLNRAKTSPYLANQTAQIENAIAINEYTVQITLNEPYAPFLLSMDQIYILNEKAVIESGEAYGENPVGTGPYKLVNHAIGEKVVLERFEEYFQEPASIKNVEFQVITDPNTAVIALETGEVDFTYTMPMISRQGIIDNPELTTHEIESINLNYLLMNTEVAPFNNKLVRQAINYAIDKDTIIQIVEEGMGQETKSIFNEYTFGYSENVKGYEYDPQKAKQLLKDAGYPEGFVVTLKTLEGNPKKIMEIVQENLKNIGITAEIEVNEANAYVQDAMSGNYNMGFMAVTLGQDAEFYSVCFKSDAINGFNMSRYSNPRVDELFDEAKTIVDRSERLQRYEELTQIIMDDAVIVPIYFPIKVYAADKDLNISNISVKGTLRIYDMSWK